MYPDDEALQGLKAYIEERYLIFLEKELHCKPWPWSQDPIFQEFRFGNVLRGF